MISYGFSPMQLLGKNRWKKSYSKTTIVWGEKQPLHSYLRNNAYIRCLKQRKQRKKSQTTQPLFGSSLCKVSLPLDTFQDIVCVTNLFSLHTTTTPLQRRTTRVSVPKILFFGHDVRLRWGRSKRGRILE